MAMPAMKPATWDDLLALPEDVRAELIGGVIEVAPRPLFHHARAQGVVSNSIGGPFDYDRRGPGGWWIITETDIAISPYDIVVPDLAGWRRERMPTPPDTRPVTLAPDWVCEILSPSTARRDRTVKAELYLSAEVGHYWLIDPAARLLEAFASRDGAWVRLGAWSDGDAPRVAPFDAIALDVGGLFPPLPEPEDEEQTPG